MSEEKRLEQAALDEANLEIMRLKQLVEDYKDRIDELKELIDNLEEDREDM